ncbi:hypothetical protein EDF58_1185 [Novosphingobium sp. PhB57]|nr:hypothetical protein EDF58_1185 [Novosphingobium sp. PhB57]
MVRPLQLPAGFARCRWNGGFTFAEAPDRDCLSARILWQAERDPATLFVEAEPGVAGDAACLDIGRICSWLTIVPAHTGVEHAVLSDGSHHIRLDVVAGSLRESRAVRLRILVDGMEKAEYGVLSLQRLLALHRHRRFGKMLYPRDPAIARGIVLLRTHDALEDGASHRDLACALVGPTVVDADWNDPSDSLRSRVRRLTRQARAMALGGYRGLLLRR